jgi:hypothetical protein
LGVAVAIGVVVLAVAMGFEVTRDRAIEQQQNANWAQFFADVRSDPGFSTSDGGIAFCKWARFRAESHLSPGLQRFVDQECTQ